MSESRAEKKARKRREAEERNAAYQKIPFAEREKKFGPRQRRKNEPKGATP